MTDLIIFGVAKNRYALRIENIQRIIQCSQLTDIPNSNQIVEGMMSYEDGVVKVLSFRKVIGLESYEEVLDALFKKLKLGHAAWVDALKLSINTGSAFTKTTDPTMCELGKWINTFTSYDDKVTEVFRVLVEFHKQLHVRGGDALELCKTDKVKAKEIVDVEINNIYNHTMGALDDFVIALDIVANSFQKLIIYESGSKTFAIKIDTIEDIAHIQESDIISSEDAYEFNEFLELDGVLDLDGVLINVIKTVNIPN
jgi:chemotaxis signal transduction protein